jgi:integrase
MRANVMRSILDEPTKPGSKFRFIHCPISEFTADHVRLLMNRKQDTPAAANRRVAELRKMLAWAVEERGQWVKRNVAAEVKGLKREVKGFIAWTAEEIAKFEAHWPVGSMPRLAVAIMLFTGVRRSDAVRLGPPMVEDGSITFMPQKTRRQKKFLTLPRCPAASARQDAPRAEDMVGPQQGGAVHGRRLRRLVQRALRRGRADWMHGPWPPQGGG